MHRATHSNKQRPAFALTAIALVALAACGGDPDEPLPTTLSGTAAIGAPIAGATVVVIDSDPATTDPASVTAGADGRYSIDISGLKAPLFIRATGTVSGEAVEQVAVVPTVAANASNTANVTPLTSAVATLVAPGGNASALATPATLAGAATEAQVSNATTLLVNTLTSDAGTAALLGTGFNPLTTSFNADGTGVDAALERVSVTTLAGQVQISNLAAPPGANGAPPPVTLTPAQVATPNIAPTLPPSVPTANLPTAAELAALGAKYEACLALPISQRVTQDASGTVTAVLGACNFVPADWKSNGRTFAQELGQFTFAKTQLTNAKVGAGQVVLALNPEGLTDPKEFKHPYCNDGPCVVARWPLTTASGKPLASDWILAKVNGAWNFVGNQRPYRAFIDPRLVRRINMNRNGAGAGNTGDPYFLKDRTESLLRVIFDLSVGDTSDVRAVRVSGPGLPTAGVVMFRSSRCGTEDRMGITYQSGSTRVIGGASNGAVQFFTGGSSTDFVMGAANLDGTTLATPAPVNTATSAAFQDFNPTPFSNLPTTVPAWSRYKFEVFRFSSSTPDVPDQVLYLRTGTGLENPGAGTAISWPTLNATYASDHLTPTGAQAGAQTSFANTLSWTLPAGAYVSSGYLFGQDLLSVANNQNETAVHAYRARIDHEPAAFGDTTAAGWRFANVAAGTAMSPSTQTAGTNPNPRCTGDARLPPLTTNVSDYREVGLSVRNGDRQTRLAVWFWDN